MKARDLFGLAARSIHPGWGTAYVLITAFAVSCLCFSVAIWTSVNTEKTEPCELTVTAPSYLDITEQTIQNFLGIPDVMDATGLVEVPVTAASGKYTTSMTLVGIDGGYLNVTYSVGEVFPADSAMPWIVLSEATAKSFIDSADKTRSDASYMPSIDWRNADFALTVGESVITAKVSGVFEGDDLAAYISLDMARQLLQCQGQPSGYTSATIRITNIGVAEAVTRAISVLGYEVADENKATQEKWDMQLREAVYILIPGIAGFICGAMLKVTEAADSQKEYSERSKAFLKMGMTEARIRLLFFVGHIYLAFVSLALGVLIHYVIAFMTPAEQRTVSVFTLTVPFIDIAVVCGSCIVIGVIISWIGTLGKKFL